MDPYAEQLLTAPSVAGCVWFATFVGRVEAEVPENRQHLLLHGGWMSWRWERSQQARKKREISAEGFQRPGFKSRLCLSLCV